MFAFNVWFGGKKIDTVFFKEHGTIAEKCEQVRQLLIWGLCYDKMSDEEKTKLRF